MARRRVPKEPEPPDVDSWAKDLPDTFLLCRDLGHVWGPHLARWDAKLKVFDQTLRCSRCLTERRRTLSARGHPIVGHYAYPKTYLAPKGVGGLGPVERDSIRLASITRLIDSEMTRARARRSASRKRA